MCVCGEWKVVTGTDYVPVILIITVGAQGVSVVDSMFTYISYRMGTLLHVFE